MRVTCGATIQFQTPPVPAELVEDDLLVPDEHAEPAVAAVHVGRHIAIVVRPVLRIAVEVQQHVIGVVLDVEVVLGVLVHRVAGAMK